jgi:sugar/nucleoside kinase (ribokinase family)
MIAEVQGRTQTAAILHTPDGERTIVVGRGDAQLRWTSKVGDALERSRVSHVNAEDPKMRARCWGAAAGGTRCLPLAHLEEEAQRQRSWDVIVGSAADHVRPAAEAVSAVAARLCVLTEGAAGGSYFAGGAWTRYAAKRVADPVDPTGAGDAFLGGLLHGLDLGQDAEAALESAAIAGAAALRRRGAWPA